MKIKTLVNSNAGVVFAAGVVVAALSYVATKKAKETIGDVGEAISPLNNNNIFANGVNAVGAKLSGNDNWSLGGWIYDITN
jgi:hypothetical protein